MCGEPRVAAECTCTERESGRCSRPTVRPGSNVNDKHDHGDGSSTRPPGRWTSGSLEALLHESELARTDPGPQLLHRPMRYDIGRPSPVI